MSPRSRNPVGDFNAAGRSKCPHCDDYFPVNWAAGHVAACPSNPANQTPPVPTEESP